MASLVFSVQSTATAGPDRVNVNLSQVAPDAVGTTATPFFGANLTLNLTQAEADAYKVNQRYTMALTLEATKTPPPA